MEPAGCRELGLTTTLPPGAHFAMLSLLTTAIGVGWGISWVTWASDYSRFVPRSVSSASVFWYSYVGMFVPTVWLAVLGATIASVTHDADPRPEWSRLCSRRHQRARAAAGAARSNRDLSSTSVRRRSRRCGMSDSSVRTALTLIVGVVGYLVTIYFVFAPSFATPSATRSTACCCR